MMKSLKEISVTELKKSETVQTFGGGSKPIKIKVEPIIKPLNPNLYLLEPYYIG